MTLQRCEKNCCVPVTLDFIFLPFLVGSVVTKASKKTNVVILGNRQRKGTGPNVWFVALLWSMMACHEKYKQILNISLVWKKKKVYSNMKLNFPDFRRPCFTDLCKVHVHCAPTPWCCYFPSLSRHMLWFCTCLSLIGSGPQSKGNLVEKVLWYFYIPQQV